MRTAGPGELLWLRIGEGGSNNGAMTVHIDGKLDQEQLRFALQRLIDSQDFLTIHAKKNVNSYQLYLKKRNNLPYQFISTADTKGYDAVKNHYLNTSFNENSPDLWKLVHIEYKDGKNTCTKLLYIGNHAISDGRSGSIFFKQLFKLYLNPELQLDKIPLRKSFESYFKKTSIRKKLQAVGTLGKNLIATKRSTFFDHPPVVSDKRYSTSIHFELSEADSSLLLNKIKEKGLKAHSIFCAAYLKAFYKAYNLSGPKTMSFSTPVDYRDMLDGDFSRDIGFFISPVNIMANLDERSSIQSIAEQIAPQVIEKTRPDYLRLSLKLYGKIIRKFNSHERFSQYARENTFNLGVISNIGKVALPKINEDIRVTQLSFQPSIQALTKPNVTFMISKYGGKLSFDFIYATPLLKTEFVELASKYLLDALVEFAKEGRD